MALLEERLRVARNDAARAVIPQLAQRSRAPLSFAQQRLWFLNQLEPGSPLYNLPVALRLRGRLDREALQKALNAIVARHEALRTRFEGEEGNPVQVIAESLPVELPVVDLSGCHESQREDKLHRMLEAESRRGFDLSRGPLLRVTLFQMAETDHVLLLVMHHIISDTWSLYVFFRELGAYYGAFRENRGVFMPELPVQYADFAVWQRGQMTGDAMEKQLAFWKRHLDGAPPIQELPAVAPGFHGQSFCGAYAE